MFHRIGRGDPLCYGDKWRERAWGLQAVLQDDGLGAVEAGREGDGGDTVDDAVAEPLACRQDRHMR